MKSIFLLVGVSIALTQTLDQRYHTYEEIQQQLLEWEEEFGSEPNSIPQYPSSGIIYELIEIGQSTTDNLPFWAVKLSYNADINEDEPKILFLGQCHAEEILGVEISMAIIDWFLHPLEHISIFTTTLRPILQNTEIWVVPTHNPEGLRVVHGYEQDGEIFNDFTFRKNITDINLDGLLTYQEGIGNDSDGVDLNRNYGFNWIFGDSEYMLDPGYGDYFSHFDYFKGHAPFSESEVQAIKELALENNFLLSIAYHSSRSGRVSEMVIYSWDWEETKKSPDYPVIDQLGQEIAGLIPKEVDVGYYMATPGKSRRGNAHDWFYSETGCIQYLVEVGTENMQPDSTMIEDTIDRNMVGVFHLLNRAFYNPFGDADAYQVTGIVTDALTGNPIEAEVSIFEMDGGMLKPRLTDEFGRFRRLLTNGNYTLEIIAKGYEKQFFTITPSAGAITIQDVQLNPLPVNEIIMEINTPDDFVEDIFVILNDDYGYDTTITSNNILSLDLPQNNYSINIVGQDLFPVTFDISLSNDTTVNVDLEYSQTIFSESFNSLDNWENISGNWDINNGNLISQTDLVYPDSSNQFLVTNDVFNIPLFTPLALNITWKYELEWDIDTITFALITFEDTVNIHRSGQYWKMHNETISLPLVNAETFKLGIGLISDETVNYRGIQIDELRIIADIDSSLSNKTTIIPQDFYILEPYPNPFNPSISITYILNRRQEMEILLFNLQGQRVANIFSGISNAGINKIIWDNWSLTSGIYFLQFKSENLIETKKIMLLK